MRSEPWRLEAACREMEPSIFHPEVHPGISQAQIDKLYAPAKAACAGCPVIDDCLEAALVGGRDVVGCWGGTTEKERDRIKRRLRRERLRAAQTAEAVS